MFLGSNKVNDMFIGTTPVASVWLGTYKVWERTPEWTYVIDNVSVNYLPTSKGEVLRPDASNYASVIGRVTSYKNGVLQDTKPTMKLGLTTTSPYISIVNDQIYFNIDDYGLTDMSMSNPFGVTDVKYHYSGTTGNAPTIYVEPNKIATTAVTTYNCSGVTNVGYLNFDQTTFQITNKNTGVVTTTYTSGKAKSAGKNLEGYLFKVNEDTGTNTLLSSLAYNASYSVSVGPVNRASFPQVYVYRMSYMNGTTGFDYFIYMMQKCQNNTSGLQLYYGANKVNGWDVESSSYFYLANNGHTDDTTYTWTTTDSEIDIKQQNGVFNIYADSATSGSVTIYDNKGNSCSFTINMYVDEYSEE